MGSSVSSENKDDNSNYKDDNSNYNYPDIPEELIMSEILCRLPVKSVVRFRCVCKSWNSVLSGDPVFVQSHVTRYAMNLDNGALIFRCTPSSGTYPKSHPLKSKFLQLGGSVDGLVCIYDYGRSTSIECVGIWNPATNHYKDIPPPPRSTYLRSDFAFGIGFDPITNDYKIVFIIIVPDQPLLAYVYSCNSGSWGSNCVKSSFLSRGTHFRRSTIVHGRPYWYNYNVTSPKHYYVMFFDVQHEVIRSLPGIDFVDHSKQDWFMVNLRNSLALMFYDLPKTDFRLVNVYNFNERSGLWTKYFTVGPITVPRSMDFRHCFANGDLLFYSDHQFNLVSINPESHAISSIGYVETLVSVHGMKGIRVDQVPSDILIVEKSL